MSKIPVEFQPCLVGEPSAVLHSSYGSGVPDVCRAVASLNVARDFPKSWGHFGFWRVKAEAA